MVFLSGAIFSTTSWETIDDIYKLIFLIFISLLFYGLSVLTDKKLNLPKTSETYWNLANSFVIFSIVSIGYFSIFGDYLSFTGEGSSLLWALMFGVGGALNVISSFKFKRSFYLYLASLLFASSLIMIMTHFEMEMAEQLAVMSTILLIANLLKSNNEFINTISKIPSLLVLPIVYLFYMAPILDSDIHLITAALIIVNVYTFSLKAKPEEIVTTLGILLSIVIIFLTMYNSSMVTEGYESLFSIVAIIVLMAISYLFKEKNKVFFDTAFIINIGIIILIWELLFSNTNQLATLLAASLLFIVGALIPRLSNEEALESFEDVVQPLKFGILSFAFYFLMSHHELLPSDSLIYSFVGLSMVVMFLLTSNITKLTSYFYLSNILLTINIVNSMITTSETYPLTILIISFLIFGFSYIKHAKNEFDKGFVVMSYSVLLITAFVQLVVNDMMNVGDNLSVLSTLTIYAVFAIALRKNKGLFAATLIIALMPLWYWNKITTDYIVAIIISRSILIYAVFLMNHFLITKDNSRGIFTSIPLTIIIVSMIFIPDILIGLFVGVLGVLLVFIGQINEHYRPLFKLGVITVVVNIIFQLREFWLEIPAWLYLLVGGLSLIGFVTYKELRKIENKKDE